KKSDLLIDWYIRNHPDKEAIQSSKVGDDYERTNVWRIQPNTHSEHPAPFPFELADKVIKYYSFKNDVVLDPFAGSGTTGLACIANKRRFVMFEINPDYVELIRSEIPERMGRASEGILWINTPPYVTQQLF